MGAGFSKTNKQLNSSGIHDLTKIRRRERKNKENKINTFPFTIIGILVVITYYPSIRIFVFRFTTFDVQL